MEIGRVELMRSLGFDYKQMEKQDDCHLPVVDVHCRYKSPAHYNEEILIRTELRHLRAWLVQFGYEIVRAQNGTVLAEAESTHVVVNSRMEKKNLPEKYRRLLASVLRSETGK